MFDNLGKNTGGIKKLLEGVGEMRNLLDEKITTDLEEKMDHEHLEKLAEVRRLSDPAMLKRKAYELMNAIKHKNE
jgi:hypothetical protein